MTFLGLELEFISYFIEMYPIVTGLIPLIFLVSQIIVYDNLNIIEKSYAYKINNAAPEEAITFLTIVLIQIFWGVFLLVLYLFPGLIAWVFYFLVLCCILPILNLASVRSLNKKLFLRKLKDD